MTDKVFGAPDADGWYEWKGDDMIRPAGLVDVVFDDGCVIEGQPADRWVWLHSGQGDDIVKWRPFLRKCASRHCADTRRPISPYCDRCEPDL